MPEVAFAGLFWLALVVAGFALAFVLPFLMYKRVKGIERALWAVVTQLQHMHQEKSSDDPVQRAPRKREPPAPTGMISTSIFGR